MKRKIRLKRRKKSRLKKKDIFFFILIFLIIFVYGFIRIVSHHVTPILLETAEFEINKFSTIMINKAISQVLEDKINTEEIFNTVKSSDGTIQTIDFNPIVVNQILNVATTVVQNNLKLLEEGNLDAIGIYDMDLPEDRIENLEKGIITKIPIGVLSKNTLLNNLGPKIPIRIHYIGDVNSNITTKITQYGINNAMVEVGVHLEMTAQIILPFVTEKKVLECNIPLAIKIIQGTVPEYYGNGLTRDSSLYSIPVK
ncbi:MAG: sporulation protein YunB [bacterium]|nr:sporulation protein YunB [bacterium]